MSSQPRCLSQRNAEFGKPTSDVCTCQGEDWHIGRQVAVMTGERWLGRLAYGSWGLATLPCSGPGQDKAGDICLGAPVLSRGRGAATTLDPCTHEALRPLPQHCLQHLLAKVFLHFPQFLVRILAGHGRQR